MNPELPIFDELLLGGVVVGPDGTSRVDVAISGGKVAALLRPGSDFRATRTTDVGGRLLLPGLVDAHVHLREPGMTQKEDFVSGTRAAAAGGVTTLLVMPTDEPWTDSADLLRDKARRAENRLHVDVAFQAAALVALPDAGELAAAGAVSVELFTADVPDAYLHDTVARLAAAMTALRPSGLTIGVSPGDQSLIEAEDAAGLPGHEGMDGFLRSRPPLAEAAGIARAVLTAAVTGARIHIRQVNSAIGVETLRRMKDMADASVETTPQCLLFTAQDYETLGARLKASPPLRSEADRMALLAGLRDGVIDIVATDHAPHAPDEKRADYTRFADIPGGFAGLQTLLPAMLHLVGHGEIGLPDIVRLCARNPALRFGLGDRKGLIALGLDADIVVLDPGRRSTVEIADQLSKAADTPFAGLAFPYAIERVMQRGVWIQTEGRVADERRGRVLTPLR